MPDDEIGPLQQSERALGSGFEQIFHPKPMQELLAVIETKNSWGKNELKDEILKILVKV